MTRPVVVNECMCARVSDWVFLFIQSQCTRSPRKFPFTEEKCEMKNKREMKRQNGWMKRHTIRKRKRKRRAQTVALYRIMLSKTNQIFLGSSHISNFGISRCISFSCMQYSRPTRYKAPSISHTRAKHSQIGFLVFNANQNRQTDR